MAERIGEILTRRTGLPPQHLEQALRVQSRTRERLGMLLVGLGYVGERDLAEALGEQLDVPVYDAAAYPESPVGEELVSPEFLRQAGAIPVEITEDGVVVVMSDPLDRFTIEALALAFGKPVVPRVGPLSDIESALRRQGGSESGAMAEIVDDLGADAEPGQDDVAQLKDLASEAPIVRVVNLIIARALAARASDIHIEPFAERLKVRYRVDGVLRDVEAPPVRSTAAVTSRIKVMANLNIAERRLPQDGRMKLRTEGREVDMRISTVPTMHGESVVLRILDRASVALDFEALGFEGETLDTFAELLDLPHGIVLVTGPTGSGKTTTLYAALQRLNTPDRKVLTVEDPIEYQLEGVNQIQVKPRIGLDFADALRSILRQDPDVIMVGEMRDLETARIAVQSALTGHKVFSTLHTNDAASSVTRLLNMGVEDYLVTSTVNGVVAQRLVRTLCAQCKAAYPALPELVAELGLGDARSEGEPLMLFRPEGCAACDRTGYRGRTTIVEILVMNDEVRKVILNKGDARAIARAASDAGALSMHADGMRKVRAGTTSVEEVERVTRDG